MPTCDWIGPLSSFVGGGVVAWGIGYFVKDYLLRPVISARIVDKRGCYVTNPVDGAKYLRLLVENMGRSSIKECSGYITEITKHGEGVTSRTQQEVLDLGWSHHPPRARNIPRGAFFHMDVVSLHLRPDGNFLEAANPLPNSMMNFFDDKATYEFAIIVAADNAKPFQRKVTFDFDPASADLAFSHDPGPS